MVCPLGQAEEEDRRQMGSRRAEEQKLTAELVAVKIRMKDAIEGRKWVEERGKKGDEGRA